MEVKSLRVHEGAGLERVKGIEPLQFCASACNPLQLRAAKLNHAAFTFGF
jgi:hypothetical protein